MKAKTKHNSKTYNNIWTNPITIIGFAITVASAGFGCGVYYYKTESNKEIAKIISEHTIEVCKYENEITLLKQK